MRHISRIFGCALVFLAPVSTWALTFHVNGSTRLTSEFDHNLLRGAGDSHFFTTIRPLLNTKLFLSDHLILISEWSLLEPTTEEFPLSVENGLAARPTSLFNILPIRGYPFGHLQALNADTAAFPVIPFRTNELYLRWETDVLRILMGRQPRKWGLGMVYEDGTTHPLFSQFKSIMDAVVMVFPFGELEIQGGFIHGVNAFFADLSDDITHFFAQAQHSEESSKMETGILIELMLLGQDCLKGICKLGQQDTPSPIANNGTLLLLDIFGIFYPLPHLRLALEGALMDGADPTTFCKDANSKSFHSLFAFAVTWDFSYRFTDILVGVWGNLVSGDKDGGEDQKNDSFILIHPNHFAGLLLNRTAYGLVTKSDNLKAALYPYQAKPGIAHVGTGQVTIKPYLEWFIGADWIIRADIPFAFVLELPKNIFDTRKGHFMGIEADVRVTYQWYENWSLSLVLSVLLPGAFFDSPAGPVNVPPEINAGIGALAAVVAHATF